MVTAETLKRNSGGKVDRSRSVQMRSPNTPFETQFLVDFVFMRAEGAPMRKGALQRSTSRRRVAAMETQAIALPGFAVSSRRSTVLVMGLGLNPFHAA